MNNRSTWLVKSRDVAKAFVAECFGSEVALFDAFWSTYSAKLAEHGENLSVEESRAVVSDLHFAQAGSVDLVTPIVISTVAETISKIGEAILPVAELEDFVGKVAGRYGARPSLIAALVGHLPKLCIEAAKTKDDDSDGVIATALPHSYKVWVGGEVLVVDDIDEYEKSRGDYLFWIDLDDRPYKSEVDPGKTVGPEAVELLKCFVEKLGARTPVEQVLADVFDEADVKITSGRKNRIEQQITKLHQYCGGKFREHLFADKFNKGLGLKDSFAVRFTPIFVPVVKMEKVSYNEA